MPWKYSGRIIRVGKAWVDNNGTQYPAIWNNYSADEKAAIGLKWEDEVAAHDNRFYWGRDADGKLIPRSLTDVDQVDEDGKAVTGPDGKQLVNKGLKTLAIETVKSQAAGLLAPYDWQVIKATEVESYSVPSSVTTYRAAVRTASNNIETAITNAADLAAFMALYDTPVDSDGEPTGNAPIVDWPDAI
ncbi:MAG TPA: hypothetical protein DCW74_18380 [Alteromonas australica]|uniref:Uncharacterized protein n=1 Tax=Alteromonas australica TaxID=589873 RepID=A0A350P8S1_9ALTE|nr:hypothetical protein [Alteromonas australica]